jgi:hypothetical protein
MKREVFILFLILFSLTFVISQTIEIPKVKTPSLTSNEGNSKTIKIPKVNTGDFDSQGDLPEPLEQTIGAKSHFYVGGSLVASQDSQGVKYYHRDRLGSNRITTNEIGEVEEEFLSLPFGRSAVD